MKQYKVVYDIRKEVIISEDEYKELYGDLTPLRESLAKLEDVSNENISFVQDYMGNTMREMED